MEQLSLTSIEGEALTVGQGSTLPTLLLFFTTVCSSCQKAAPAISQQLKPLQKHLQLVAIGRDHSAEELQAWPKKTMSSTTSSLIPSVPCSIASLKCTCRASI